MSLTVTRFEHARDHMEWDALCRAAPMATFQHTRSFLSYHGDRFQDESRIVRDARGRMLGVLPAARQPGMQDTVSTHPGASFGGLVHAGELLGEDLIKALAMVCESYQQQGFKRLRYKLTPHIYHRWPCGDDAYALWRLGAVPYRYDLSSSIDVSARRSPNSRRRRALRNAREANMGIHEEVSRLEVFWSILADNLAERHGAKPVHSVDEMRLLMARFPTEISLLTAEMDGAIEAGVLLFDSDRVSHAQYIACSRLGRERNLLDALFEHGIERASASGHRYFDFGISNEDEGQRLNTGLYQFKSEFGGGGVLHSFHELLLDENFSQRCDTFLRGERTLS